MFTQITVVCKDDEREEQMGNRSGDRFKQCIEVMQRQERNEMSKQNSKTRPQIYQPKTKKTPKEWRYRISHKHIKRAQTPDKRQVKPKE